MVKRFKLKLSIPNFRFYRSSKNYPAAFCFSPVNPKARDISFPTGPQPPPTTPYHPKFKTESHNRHEGEFADKSVTATHMRGLCAEEDGSIVCVVGKKGAVKIKTLKNFSSFSSCEVDGEDEERDALISSFDSLAEDFGFSAIGWERDGSVKKRNKKRPGVLWRLRGEAERAVVEGGMAVVKKSEEPYEDFKRSMLDIILLKQMYQVDELESLLQCFLSLNSPEYHATIVDAFTEIWELLVCENSKHY